jgi:hypothetical protein
MCVNCVAFYYNLVGVYIVNYVSLFGLWEVVDEMRFCLRLCFWVSYWCVFDYILLGKRMNNGLFWWCVIEFKLCGDYGEWWFVGYALAKFDSVVVSCVIYMGFYHCASINLWSRLKRNWKRRNGNLGFWHLVMFDDALCLLILTISIKERRHKLWPDILFFLFFFFLWSVN